MFFPVSKPCEEFEVIPTSIVGHSNALRSLKYHVRPLSVAEQQSRDLSNLVAEILNSRGNVNDCISSAPLFNAGSHTESYDESNYSQSSDLSFLSRLKGEIRTYLETGVFPDLLRAESEQPKRIGAEGQGDLHKNSAVSEKPPHQFVNIHSLGENSAEVLNSASIKDETIQSSLTTPRLLSARSVNTPAEGALKQNVFDVSKVFDLSDVKDVELFGLSRNDLNDGSSEEEGFDEQQEEPVSASKTSKIERFAKQLDMSNSHLDDELDTVIGESFGIMGDLETLKKKKARLEKKKSNDEDNVWSSEDTTDVSDFSDLVPEMAIDYPFNLDVFQKRAVYRLERDENVFVGAHTSAGKTVVAEYAIALAMQRKTKVIYTSPIKTLSNQKFRDFTDRFGDVGIITGDMSINPEASCLVMTTEILRSMLYKGADLIRDLSHVIFDECHWLNDPERGVVWEEAIILLPSAVTIVMLSATVPNAMEFAKWVGRTKQKPVFVLTTKKRPVPLSHQMFVKGEMFTLFDSTQQRFLRPNFKRAQAHHKESTKDVNLRTGGGRNHAWMSIIKYLRKRSLDPAIFFCFSKKKCDEAADHLHTQDLTGGASEKNQIHLFYQSAIARLSQNDKDVPQISRHRDMLKRGIGVHHAGILPIIKEITEVLFQRGLIRILFATETFAMGVNMPARTVVFSAIKKFDNVGHRLLEPGEYIQMAGRAGRRGLDSVGTVLLYPTAADFPLESDVRTVLTGTPKPLRSQFRLTNNMILNLLRIDELRVEDVMARSFSEAPAGRTSGTVKKLLQRGNETLTSMQSQAGELSIIRDIFQMSQRVDSLSSSIADLIRKGKNSASNVLRAGRVVLIRSKERTFRVGVISRGYSDGKSRAGPSLRFNKPSSSSTSSAPTGTLKCILLCGGPGLRGAKSPLYDYTMTKKDKQADGKQFNCNGLIVETGEVPLDNIDGVATLTLGMNERDLNPIRGRPSPAVLSSAAEDLRRIATDASTWESFPSLHPRKDLGLQELDAEDFWVERESLVQAMCTEVHRLLEIGAIGELGPTFDRLAKESQLESKLQILRNATSDDSLQLMPEYKQRVLVLQKLEYIDGIAVRLKGRAACEVNTCESIILTELVFEQALQQLNAVDLAAILSAFVFTQKLDEGEAPAIEEMQQEAPELVAACRHVNRVLFALGEVQAEMKLSTSGNDFIRNNANFGFVKGVRDWAAGKTFADVCKVYNGIVPEGTIVRTIVRLCELIRELKNVGRVIGDPALQGRADEAVNLCRRDVIFAASLYVSQSLNKSQPSSTAQETVEP